MQVPYIIAEIGFNHEGIISVAHEMIKAAAGAGANAVKFQTYRAIDIELPVSPNYEVIRKGELTPEDHKILAEIAAENGVDFLSTPFSAYAVDILEEINIPAYKVASMDCTNKHLLGLVARTKKPIYLSVGMATLDEISETLNFLERNKSGKVTLLHCLSLYPATANDLNLDIIPRLKELFGLPVGYSDHHPGVKACLAAAMLGADVIETHFTLDNTKSDGDHAHSANPDELKKLIEDIALFKTMRGNKDAVYNRPDRSFASKFRRGVYTAGDFSKGHVLTESDTLQTRPPNDLTPCDLEWLTGKKLTNNLTAYHALCNDDLE